MRLYPLVLAAVLLAGAAYAQDSDTGGDESSIFTPRPTPLFKSPPYLPRGFYAGAFAGNRMILPQLRLSWEWSIYHLRNDMLFLTVEGGGGYAFDLPKTFDTFTQQPPLDYFYQHVALGGFGYRMDRFSRLHFAAQVTTGVLFYGARTPGYTQEFKENFVVGTLEGRFEFGWQLGPAVWGAWVAYSAPYLHPPLSFSQSYLGGALGGLFVNWH